MVEAINTSQVASDAISSLGTAISPFIGIIKAVGVLLILYIIFLIAKGIMNFKNQQRVKRIEENVIEINKKLDLFVKKPQKGSALPESALKSRKSRKK